MGFLIYLIAFIIIIAWFVFIFFLMQKTGGQKYFPKCKICGKETTRTGNTTNMILAGIRKPEEFNDKYGMMCSEHASEVTKRIIEEKHISDEDLRKAYKEAIKLICSQLGLTISPNIKDEDIALSTIVSINENGDSSVEFISFKENTNLHEYVRLVLWYYLHMWWIFDRNSSEGKFAANMLRTSMQVLLDAGLDRNANVLRIVNIDDVVRFTDHSLEGECNIYKIEDTLFISRIDPLKRGDSMKLPSKIYTQYMAFSVHLLIQKVIELLPTNDILLLNSALRGVNNKMDAITDFSDFNEAFKIPDEAYFNSLSK